MRWGKTLEDDPQSAPAPEILDIEISTICHKACTHCYKSNTGIGERMSLDTFKILFSKLPKSLTQIAFGIGDPFDEMFDIFQYCRDNNVIPNVTVNGEMMSKEYYDKLATLCGAVAVSLYDYDTCYNAVKELTDRGMKQVNIHCLVAKETEEKCFKVLQDSKLDKRLEKLNAIVFLRLKPKGLRNSYSQLSKERFKELITYALDNNIRFGMDSCSAPLFLDLIKDKPELKKLETLIEPCESSCFSYYVNTKGIAYPCSFTEGEGIEGINVLECNSFDDVWNNENTKKFREVLINNSRCCPMFSLK
jgi:hypothetical protein